MDIFNFLFALPFVFLTGSTGEIEVESVNQALDDVAKTIENIRTSTNCSKLEKRAKLESLDQKIFKCKFSLHQLKSYIRKAKTEGSPTKISPERIAELETIFNQSEVKMNEYKNEKFD